MTRRTRTVLLRGALAIALALLILALVDQWHSVSSAARQLSVVAVVESLCAALVGLGASGLAWRALLGGFGARLPIPVALRVFFIGQLGKYLPGSVWPVLAQMELSRDLGVSRVQAGGASVVALALSAPTAVLVAAVTLPFVSANALTHYWPALLVLPIAAVLLHPPVLNRLLNRLLRLARRSPLPQPIERRPLLATLGWMVLSWVAYGVSTWALAVDLGASGGLVRRLMVCIGGYALAWAAGFLVVIVPAGAGVREAALVLTLSPVLASGPATLLALISRLVFTVGDLLWAGIGGALRPSVRPAGSSEMDNSRTTTAAQGTASPHP